MLRSKTISVIIIITGIILVIVGLFFFRSPSLISPLSRSSLPPQNLPASTYRIIGFLPYWNVSSLNYQSLSRLTDLMYFSLEPNRDGSLATSSANPESQLGYRWLNHDSTYTIFSLAREHNISTHLVIKLFDPEIIPHLCQNPTSQTNFINHLNSIMIKYQFSGINLDYEPTSPLNSSTISSCTSFFQKLYQHLKTQHPDYSLSLDILAKAGDSSYGADLSSWQPYFDFIIVMTYDYHRPNSSIAGPISPLYSPQSHAIIKNLKQISSLVRPSQIILGIPFYGYRWQTVDSNFKSQTYPRSATMITYQKIADSLTDSTTNMNWNTASLTPWILEKVNDQYFQTYFENPTSIAYKIDLVTSANLGGVAVWAIGYEGNHTNIWQPITALTTK